MKKIKIYGPFVLGIFILLWVSLLLPRIIFRVQDGYRLQAKNGESWEFSENKPVSAGYERDMYQRMSVYAGKNPEELTVSAISYGGKNVDEVVELLERVFASEWMGTVNEMTKGMYYEFLQETSTVNIRDCKKYVVYENTSLGNILLMMWYVDIYMVGYDTSVRLLIDTETEAVYYITISGEGEQIEVFDKADKNVSVSYEEYGAFLGYELSSLARYFVPYFNFYYASGMEDLEGFPDDIQSSDELWYVTSVEEKDKWGISVVMPYGNLSTDFEVEIALGRNQLPDYRLGVRMIGDIVPEMIQN